MINITQSVLDNILDYFSGKDVQPVRVFLNEGG